MALEPELLPDGALLLHLGPPKTGSTAIQRAMHVSRTELAEHDVYYPGPFHPAPAYRPSEASRAAIGATAAIGRRPPRISLWHDVVADLAGSSLARACLSSETFARAGDDAADAIVSDLGPDRVHLVYTARRIDRLLPSHWQERVKSRLTWRYHDYLRLLAAPYDGADTEQQRSEWRLMWSGHDVGSIVHRWGRLLPSDRFTIVVADEDDHDLLTRTFAALLGVPPELLRTPPGANRSLTLSQAEAVRRVNQLFVDHDWSGRAYHEIVQLGLARTLKAAERGAGNRKLGLPSDVLPAIHDRADAQVEAILGSGARIIGDPASLRTRGRVQPDDSLDLVDAVSLETLAQVVQGVLEGAFDLQERAVRRAGRAPDQPTPGVGRSLRDRLRRR